MAQTISYEIRMALIVLSFLLIRKRAHLLRVIEFQEFGSFIIISLPIIFMFIVCCVAETNRSPFDFAEGESELVSGFNVEYGRGGFALLFLAEYASILFLASVSASFLGFLRFSGVIFMGACLFYCLL